MQPGLRADNLYLIAELSLQRGQESGSPLPVPPAHPPHMPFVGATGDQVRQGFLFQARRVPIRQPLRRAESRAQHLWNHEIAEPQGGG
jgi:hypothetical protein